MRHLSLVFFLLGAACTFGGESTPTLQVDTPVPSETSVGETSDLPGRIVSLTDGNVRTMLPDGTDITPLTDDASGQIFHQQPTWGSPDRLAWTTVDLSGTEPTTAVHVSAPEGSDFVEFEVPFAPFYYFWNRHGSRLAALGAHNESLALLVVEPESGVARQIGSGQPYYLSWSPDGDRLVTHTGDQVTELLPLDGEVETLSVNSSGFQAPSWSSRDQIAYVVEAEQLVAVGGTASPQAQATPSRSLLLIDPAGGVTEVIATFRGFASFGFSEDGRFLAYSITDELLRVQAGANFGPLAVVDLDGTSTIEVTDTPVVAYQWSPTGHRLLYAAVSEDSAETGVRWHVWTNGASSSYEVFSPSRLFGSSYLPFWDQYAQSMRLWAPDSSAFTYSAGAGERDEIRVQRLGDDQPHVIGTGSIAAWSP